MAHAARRSRQQQPSPRDPARGAQQPQRGQACQRQGGRDLARDLVRKDGQADGRHAHLLGPAAVLDVGDDARAGGRPAAVAGSLQDAARDVLTRRLLAT